METAANKRIQPKTQKVFRNYDGSWDEVEEVESPDISRYGLTYNREFTSEGELVFEIEFDQKKKEIQKQLNSYNDKGKITKHELYNEGELVETILFEYDEKGNLASEYREFEEGYPLKTIYAYDDENRIVEKRVEDSDGELEKRERFEYHPEWKEKVVKHEMFDEENELTSVETTEFELRNGEVKIKCQIAKDVTINVVRKTLFYDAKEREDGIAYVVYNEKEKVVELFKVIFDEKKREIEEHSESVVGSENFQVFYEYDDEDRVILQEHRQGDRILSKHNRKFNEKSLPSFHSFRSHNRGMHIDYFEYSYYD